MSDKTGFTLPEGAKPWVPLAVVEDGTEQPVAAEPSVTEQKIDPSRVIPGLVSTSESVAPQQEELVRSEEEIAV